MFNEITGISTIFKIRAIGKAAKLYKIELHNLITLSQSKDSSIQQDWENHNKGKILEKTMELYINTSHMFRFFN